MRTRNEKILFGIVILIILGAINFYGYQWFNEHLSKLVLERAELRADQAEAMVSLQKEAVWAQRKAWLQDHQPSLGQADDAGAEVLQYVLKGARDHKLEILEQSLADNESGVAGTRINVAIKIKGSMEDMCKWLSELQQPSNFYSVNLSMKADQDQKSMVCSLQIARCFKGGP